MPKSNAMVAVPAPRTRASAVAGFTLIGGSMVKLPPPVATPARQLAGPTGKVELRKLPATQTPFTKQEPPPLMVMLLAVNVPMAVTVQAPAKTVDSVAEAGWAAT